MIPHYIVVSCREPLEYNDVEDAIARAKQLTRNNNKSYYVVKTINLVHMNLREEVCVEQSEED